MSTNKRYTKDPDSELDYDVDWKPASKPWLADDETIQTSTWLISPLEVDENNDPLPGTLTGYDQSFTDTTAVTWLRGGILGRTYQVVNRITTSQGRTEDKTLPVTITQH